MWTRRRRYQRSRAREPRNALVRVVSRETFLLETCPSTVPAWADAGGAISDSDRGSAYARTPPSAVSRHPHIVGRPEWCPKKSPHPPSSTGLSTGLRDARCCVTACASGVQVKARQTSPPRARRTCSDNHEGASSVIRQRSASFRGSLHPNAPLRLRHVRPFAPMWLDQRAAVRGMGPASSWTITSSCGYARELSTELSTGATSTRSYGGELHDWRESAPAFHVKLRVRARRAVERLSSVGAIQASVHGRYLPHRRDPTLGER